MQRIIDTVNKPPSPIEEIDPAHDYVEENAVTTFDYPDSFPDTQDYAPDPIDIPFTVNVDVSVQRGFHESIDMFNPVRLAMHSSFKDKASEMQRALSTYQEIGDGLDPSSTEASTKHPGAQDMCIASTPGPSKRCHGAGRIGSYLRGETHTISLFEDMTPPYKQILLISFPIVIAQLLLGIYGYIDIVLLGQRYGLVPMAGALEVSALENILAVQVIQALAVGASTLISPLLGNGQTDKCAEVFTQYFLLGVGLSILVPAVILPNIEKLLVLIGVIDQYMPDALLYGRAAFWMIALVTFLGNSMSAILKCENKSLLVMFKQIAGTLLNIILDVSFIYGLNMSSAAPAWATNISQLVVGIWITSFFFRKRSFSCTCTSHRSSAAPPQTEDIAGDEDVSISMTSLPASAYIDNVSKDQYPPAIDGDFGPDIATNVLTNQPHNLQALENTGENLIPTRKTSILRAIRNRAVSLYRPPPLLRPPSFCSAKIKSDQKPLYTRKERRSLIREMPEEVLSEAISDYGSSNVLADTTILGNPLSDVNAVMDPYSAAALGRASPVSVASIDAAPQRLTSVSSTGELAKTLTKASSCPRSPEHKLLDSHMGRGERAYAARSVDALHNRFTDVLLTVPSKRVAEKSKKYEGKRVKAGLLRRHHKRQDASIIFQCRYTRPTKESMTFMGLIIRHAISTYALNFVMSIAAIISMNQHRKWNPPIEALTLQMGAFLSLRVTTLLNLPMNALTAGVIPVIGFNLGSKKQIRTFLAIKSSLIIMVAASVVNFVFFMCFADVLSMPLNLPERFYKGSAKCIRVVSTFVMMTPFTNLSVIILQLQKRPTYAMLLSLTKFVATIGYMIIYPLVNHNSYWIIFGGTFGDGFSGCFGIGVFLMLYRHYKQKADEEAAALLKKFESIKNTNIDMMDSTTTIHYNFKYLNTIAYTLDCDKDIAPATVRDLRANSIRRSHILEDVDKHPSLDLGRITRNYSLRKRTASLLTAMMPHTEHAQCESGNSTLA